MKEVQAKKLVKLNESISRNFAFSGIRTYDCIKTLASLCDSSALDTSSANFSGADRSNMTMAARTHFIIPFFLVPRFNLSR